MKVTRIALNRLHNQEWFKFFSDFKERVEHFGSSAVGIKKLFDKFTPLYQKADDLPAALRKSTYTKKLEEADKKRDELFRSFRNIVKGSLAQPSESKREAAGQLYNLLERHRKPILAGNYAAESAALRNLLQELKGNYAAGIALLGLTDWTEGLEAAGREFLSVWNERTGESIAKPKERLRKFRIQIDALYAAMADVLDAQLLADDLGGDAVADPADPGGNVPYNFVLDWNETVRKYHVLLAQRTARRARKQEPGEPEAQPGAAAP
jgi:hypothetical protein